MNPLSTGAMDCLWQGMERIAQARASTLVRSREPPPLLTRAALAKNLRGYLAWAWTRRHPLPESQEALAQAVAASEPVWTEKLEHLFDTVLALEAMDDGDFRWRYMDDEVPTEGQEVIYFFEVVGTHPGHYEAPDPNEKFSMDTFVGDFGGFLSGDVTHWMPRPVLVKTANEDSFADRIPPAQISTQ